MNLYRTSGFSMLPEVVKNLLIINVLAYLARMVFLVNFEIDLNDYFGLHYWEAEKFRPYQFVTYMFMHGGLWHVVFNMYMLYWFGRIFNDFMGEKRLAGLYFLGGIAGGAAYLLVYNLLFLAGETDVNVILVGSSAAVMAITIAAGLRFPDYTINLMFFGTVRLKYVALVIFILSTVLDFSSNMGGKIAHIGGAAMGYFGKCTSGTCPLTATPWRGALYGAVMGAVFSLALSKQ